ncbi:MAG: hypothetical protein Q9178_007358 [Gyalolechia marmorata]
MICHRCLRLRLSSSPLLPLNRLPYSTARSPSPATSTSAAQPFSTPFTPSPYLSTSPTSPTKSTKSSSSSLQPSVSALKAGTPLKGLSFEKNRETPLAREDSEYPEWLWGLLDKGKMEGEGSAGGGGDAFFEKDLYFLRANIHIPTTQRNQRNSAVSPGV